MSREEIKNRIWEQEFINNGLGHLSGADVIVKNLRKVSATIWYADIILVDYNDNREERFNDCKYDETKFPAPTALAF